jgi:hypothetical protein
VARGQHLGLNVALLSISPRQLCGIGHKAGDPDASAAFSPKAQSQMNRSSLPKGARPKATTLAPPKAGPLLLRSMVRFSPQPALHGRQHEKRILSLRTRRAFRELPRLHVFRGPRTKRPPQTQTGGARLPRPPACRPRDPSLVQRSPGLGTNSFTAVDGQCVTVTANKTMIAALREPSTANGTSSCRYFITTLDG